MTTLISLVETFHVLNSRLRFHKKCRLHFASADAFLSVTYNASKKLPRYTASFVLPVIISSYASFFRRPSHALIRAESLFRAQSHNTDVAFPHRFAPRSYRRASFTLPRSGRILDSLTYHVLLGSDDVLRYRALP